MSPPNKPFTNNASLTLKSREYDKGIAHNINQSQPTKERVLTSFSQHHRAAPKPSQHFNTSENHKGVQMSVDAPSQDIRKGNIDLMQGEPMVVDQVQVGINPTRTRSTITVPPANHRPEDAFVGGPLRAAVTQVNVRRTKNVGNASGSPPSFLAPVGIDPADWQRRIKEQDFYPPSSNLNHRLNNLLLRQIEQIAMVPDSPRTNAPAQRHSTNGSFTGHPATSIPNLLFNWSNTPSAIRPRRSSGTFAQPRNQANPEEACPIYHEEYQPETMIAKMPHCDHWLCKPCTEGCLQHKDACPICRTDAGGSPSANSRSPPVTANDRPPPTRAENAPCPLLDRDQGIPLTVAQPHVSNPVTSPSTILSTFSPSSQDEPLTDKRAQTSPKRTFARLPRPVRFYAFGPDTHNLGRERTSSNWRTRGHPVPHALARKRALSLAVERSAAKRSVRGTTTPRPTPPRTPITTRRPSSPYSRAQDVPILPDPAIRPQNVPITSTARGDCGPVAHRRGLNRAPRRVHTPEPKPIAQTKTYPYQSPSRDTHHQQATKGRNQSNSTLPRSRPMGYLERERRGLSQVPRAAHTPAERTLPDRRSMMGAFSYSRPDSTPDGSSTGSKTSSDNGSVTHCRRRRMDDLEPARKTKRTDTTNELFGPGRERPYPRCTRSTCSIPTARPAAEHRHDPFSPLNPRHEPKTCPSRHTPYQQPSENTEGSQVTHRERDMLGDETRGNQMGKGCTHDTTLTAEETPKRVDDTRMTHRSVLPMPTIFTDTRHGLPTQPANPTPTSRDHTETGPFHPPNPSRDSIGRPNSTPTYTRGRLDREEGRLMDDARRLLRTQEQLKRLLLVRACAIDAMRRM